MKPNNIILVSVLLITVGIINSSNASDNGFSLLCIEQKSTGFTWKDGKWLEQNFYPEKYIVKKITKKDMNKNDPLDLDMACLESEKVLKDPRILGNKKMEYSCYNIRDFGTEYYDFTTEACAEFWAKDQDTSEYNLTTVACDNFSFSISEVPIQFQTGNLSSSLSQKPKKNYKESLYVSFGTCDQI